MGPPSQARHQKCLERPAHKAENPKSKECQPPSSLLSRQFVGPLQPSHCSWQGLLLVPEWRRDCFFSKSVASPEFLFICSLAKSLWRTPSCFFPSRHFFLGQAYLISSNADWQLLQPTPSQTATSLRLCGINFSRSLFPEKTPASPGHDVRLTLLRLVEGAKAKTVSIRRRRLHSRVRWRVVPIPKPWIRLRGPSHVSREETFHLPPVVQQGY